MSLSTDWMAQVRHAFFPFAMSVADRDAFRASSRFCGTRALRLGQLDVDAHAVWLNRTDTAPHADDMVKMLWMLDGQAVIEHGNGACQVRQGQWMLYDISRAYHFRADTRTSFLTAVCDRRMLGVPAEMLRCATPQPLAGLAALSMQSIRAVLTQQLSFTPALERVLRYNMQQSVLEAASFEAGGPQPDRPYRAQVRDDAMQYIQQHYHDPNLQAETIAAHLGVSRRTLFAAFADTAQTPARYLQTCRLIAARQQLMTSAIASVNITTLALQVGFNDAAHFSRRYRQQYGESPSATRAH